MVRSNAARDRNDRHEQRHPSAAAPREDQVAGTGDGRVRLGQLRERPTDVRQARVADVEIDLIERRQRQVAPDRAHRQRRGVYRGPVGRRRHRRFRRLLRRGPRLVLRRSASRFAGGTRGPIPRTVFAFDPVLVETVNANLLTRVVRLAARFAVDDLVTDVGGADAVGGSRFRFTAEAGSDDLIEVTVRHGWTPRPWRSA